MSEQREALAKALEQALLASPALARLLADTEQRARLATLEELRGRLVELSNAYSITSQTRADSVDHMNRLQSKGHGVDRAVMILDGLLTEARR